MRRITASAAALILTSCCLAGCAGEGDPTATVVSTLPSPAVGDGESLDIRHHALSLEDLPAGWLQEQVDDDDEGEGDDGGGSIAGDDACLMDVGAHIEPVAETQVEFIAEAGLPSLTQGLAQVVSAEVAESLITDLDDIIRDCSEVDITSDGGEEATMQVQPLTLPTILGADHQTATQLRVEIRGNTLTGAYVVLSQGTTSWR